MKMSQITRKNHFVQQAYLQRWSNDGVNVCAYRLLVSHPGVPAWARRAISGLGFHTDLYTSAMQGQDSDEVERWIERDYESPAQEPIERLLRGEHLGGEEWQRIGQYAAVQDVRTPAEYLEFKVRWERDMPGLIDSVMGGSVRELEQLVAAGKPLPSADEDERGQAFDRRFPFPLVVKTRVREDGQGEIGTEVTIGRALWLASMPIRLAAAARAISGFRWSVLRPYAGCEWFTTDRPLIRLNFYEPGKFDFGGGWGNPGSELVLPLSPTHLLYTKVGAAAGPTVTLTRAQTFEMQQLMAKGAFRWIFAREEARRVAWMRPRTVDEERFRAEERQWKEWHQEQSAAEREIFESMRSRR
jgi:hypothetical protein